MDLLPQDAREKIERFVGERNLARFIVTEINNDRDRTDPKPLLVAGQPLTQLPFVANPITYARKLIGTLEGLPYRYQLTAALPGTFSHKLINFVPDHVSLPSGIIIAKGSALSPDFPVHSPHSAVDTDLFHDWFADEQVDRAIRDDRLYFSMPLLGYAVPSSSSVVGRHFEDHIKAFFGAAMATNLMSYGSDGDSSKLPYIMIHDKQTREILATESLEDEILERNYLCSSKSFIERDKSVINSAYRTALGRIGTIFNDHIDCRRLFAACIWYYRAKTNRRPLDALLQATISIEVMLGDRKSAEGVGLTNLLASRCAYLLGRSSAHRAEIEEKFRRVYELRSQIVHEGRHTLKLADSDTVKLGNSLCAAIISRELSIRAMPEEN